MFDVGRCETCPVLVRCPVTKGKRDNYYLRYDSKAMRLAKRRLPELQGCCSQGETYEEALKNISDAIRLHAEDRLA